MTFSMGNRSPRGLRFTKMRPLLPSEALMITVSMAGCSCRIRPTSCSRSVSAGKEMSSTASAVTSTCPRSSVGKKPLGMATKSATLAASEPAATACTTRRCPRHQSSVRAYFACVQR